MTQSMSIIPQLQHKATHHTGFLKRVRRKDCHHPISAWLSWFRRRVRRKGCHWIQVTNSP